MKKYSLEGQPNYAKYIKNEHKDQHKTSKKYSLIYQINELKAPVVKVIQDIFKNPKQNKENKGSLQKVASQFTKTFEKSTNFNSMNQTNSSKRKDEHLSNSINNRFNETLSSPKKYVSRVSRILSRKHNVYENNQDQSIDRLNARLDNYIIKNIGVQKVKQLRSSV